MKASDFVKVLRKVMREEMRTVLKEELSAMKPLISEAVATQLKKRAKLAEHKPVVANPPQPVRKTQPIVSMDDFDNMLNEGIDDEWPDMNGGPMTSDFFASDSEFGMNGFAPQQLHTNQPVQNFGSSDPLLKDYSKLLKAADNHANGFRG
jgi:hypothetical protein